MSLQLLVNKHIGALLDFQLLVSEVYKAWVGKLCWATEPETDCHPVNVLFC